MIIQIRFLFYFFLAALPLIDCNWLLSPCYFFSPVVSALMQFAGLIWFWERVVNRKQGLPKRQLLNVVIG